MFVDMGEMDIKNMISKLEAIASTLRNAEFRLRSMGSVAYKMKLKYRDIGRIKYAIEDTDRAIHDAREELRKRGLDRD
jgi:hypothetical protein